MRSDVFYFRQARRSHSAGNDATRRAKEEKKREFREDACRAAMMFAIKRLLQLGDTEKDANGGLPRNSNQQESRSREQMESRARRRSDSSGNNSPAWRRRRASSRRRCRRTAAAVAAAAATDEAGGCGFSARPRVTSTSEEAATGSVDAPSCPSFETRVARRFAGGYGSAGRILAGVAAPRTMTTVIFLLCALVVLQTTRPTAAAFTTVSTVPDPEFVDEIGNITVPAGRSVRLACSVKDLGSYKVAWMLFDKSAILTVHTHVITRNPRISVSHDKHRTWYLHINNVQEDDKGKYMCQINTATAKTHYGYLHVVVPPNIDDALSSSDAIVRENANVTLTCKATGSPPPTIRWKRDDNAKIAINKSLEVNEWEGETLEMVKISRLGMGAYLCIAFNGIPPTVSKQIKVSVDFSPMLSIPHQLVGAPLGYSVTLECYTEAHPTSLNYWTRGDSGNMIIDSKKYKTTTTPEKPSYKTHMTLTINNIKEEDYGGYKCVAKNPRGSTDGIIRLYKSTPPSTSPSPVTTDLARKGWDPVPEMNNSVDGNPSSLTFHNDKNSKQGKSGSNLNEIDKSEQKSVDLDRKRNYNWPPESDSSASYATTGTLLALGIIVTWIIR